MSKKKIDKTEVTNKICINVFCYENKLTYPDHISDQKFEKWICCLHAMKINHIMCTLKILTDLCLVK